MKESLLVDFSTVDNQTANTYNCVPGGLLLKHDFVLVSETEATKLREKNSLEALAALGRKMKLLDGLPVPDVD